MQKYNRNKYVILLILLRGQKKFHTYLLRRFINNILKPYLLFYEKRTYHFLIFMILKSFTISLYL